MEAEAAIAVGRDAERQDDQFLRLLRKRTGGQAGLRKIAEALHEGGQVAAQSSKLARDVAGQHVIGGGVQCHGTQDARATLSPG
jgi:hypothetical protein